MRAVLLADEVLAVGDQHFQAKCFEKFEEIKRQQKTVILISHSLEQLKRHCVRGVLLNMGRIVSDERMDDVCKTYSAL